MKLISCVIRPMKLGEVCEALAAIGVGGVTVSVAEGFGKRGRTDLPRGIDSSALLQPKARIEVAVRDDMADAVVDAMISAAQTGHLGDGKVFVVDLQQVVRIRNRDAGEDAL